ncbi:hypothetical protein QJQ45_014652 [Haematococcus lacustris]|nr:hypothetical protein QJQ45_014652 [Haematococcus lacustris]
MFRLLLRVAGATHNSVAKRASAARLAYASQKKRKRPVFPETSAAGKPQSLTKDQTSEELSHDATQSAQAQLTPPVQLGIWDPKLLAQIKAAMGLLTTASVLEHLMRGPYWVPPAGQVIQRLVRPAKSQRHAKYVRGLLWCHERIRKSMQRPLELRIYEGLEALSPIGKEYQQGYKLVNDRLPKGRQRLHRAAEYRRGNDGRARSNA